jgi:alkylhydroperoxidase/carboxymuconolactone decarboxylase family protein YurZ
VNGEGHHPDSIARLSAKDLRMLNIAVAVAQNRSGELRMEIERGLQNGVTRYEIRGIVDEVVRIAGGRVDDCIQVVEHVLSDLDL